jgi:hypothetical protein
MKTIVKNRKLKKQTLLTYMVILLMITLYGCYKEDDILSITTIDVCSIEGDKIANSDEFVEYASDLAEYNLKFQKIVESLSEEERSETFGNISNEEYLMIFLEKHDLLNATLNILSKTNTWKQKVNLERNFTAEEQEMIYYNAFRTNSKPKVPLVRLKSGDENNSNSNDDFCSQQYQSAINYANAIYALELLGCACLANPIVCAACIAAASLQLKQSCEKAEREYQSCKRK